MQGDPFSRKRLGGYIEAGGSHLRQKSSERLVKDNGPIDIFVDVESAQEPSVLMKSPSPMVTIDRLGPTTGSSSPQAMNSLEARIRQKQSERARGYGCENYNAVNKEKMIMAEVGQSQSTAGTRDQQPSQLQRLTGKLTEVDTRLQEAQTLTDSKFNQLNGQMVVIQEFIDEDREFREQLRRIRRDELKQLEDVFLKRFDEEAQTRRDTERSVNAFIEERCSLLQNEVNMQTKECQESITVLESELETEFPGLQDCNQAESHERQEQDTLLIKRVVEEASAIQATVSAERKAREASEEQVLELIKSMVDTIRQDLLIERQTREQSEEQLLALLEDTCAKLNAQNTMV